MMVVRICRLSYDLIGTALRFGKNRSCATIVSNMLKTVVDIHDLTGQAEIYSKTHADAICPDSPKNLDYRGQNRDSVNVP